ncbi:MAG: isoprenylcysteine carboxylmethyltransferase family protein [Caldilineaceae bacterium]
MSTILRHLLSILLLPFVVVIVVPYWLRTIFGAVDHHWTAGSVSGWIAGAAGILILLIGFSLFAWCVILFARIGRGTLAPWDPTHNLVANGPYRFVRNPMISGVFMMLLGQALCWGSWFVGLWACLFFGINHIYFILSEEPGLEKRFGEPYRIYKAHVPRWLPRLKPWPDNAAP